MGEIQLGDRLARKRGRGDRLRLALDGFGVDGWRLFGRRLLRPGVIALLIFKEDLGDAGVSRMNENDDGERSQESGGSRNDDPIFSARDAGEQSLEIDRLAGRVRRATVLDPLATHSPTPAV